MFYTITVKFVSPNGDSRQQILVPVENNDVSYSKFFDVLWMLNTSKSVVSFWVSNGTRTVYPTDFGFGELEKWK